MKLLYAPPSCFIVLLAQLNESREMEARKAAASFSVAQNCIGTH